MTDTYRSVVKILRNYRRDLDSIPDLVPFIKLAEKSPSSSSESSSILSDPPFEATVISPDHSPITLYLGNVSDAMYPAALKERNIVAILNVAGRQCRDVQRMEKIAGNESPETTSQWERIEFNQYWYSKQLSKDSFKYLQVDAEDHSRYKISDDFEVCIEFLNHVEMTCVDTERKPGVLVHCMQGLNRSGAVAGAWLVHRWNMTLSEAVTSIATRRKGILTNRSFVRQLVDWSSPDEIVPDRVITPPKVVHIGNIVERSV